MSLLDFQIFITWYSHQAQPKVTLYRGMTKFDKVAFKAELKEKLDKIDPTSYLSFENTLTEMLDKHAPAKNT